MPFGFFFFLLSSGSVLFCAVYRIGLDWFGLVWCVGFALVWFSLVWYWMGWRCGVDRKEGRRRLLLWGE